MSSANVNNPNLDHVNLDFVNAPVPAEFDYTDGATAAYYTQQVTTLANFFNTPSVDSSGNPQPVTFTDADGQAAAQALQNLVNAAQNGFVNGVTPPPPGTNPANVSYFTTMMVTNLDLLLRTFQAVGVTDPLTSITGAQLTEWKNVSILSSEIQNILNAALNAGGPANKSLQAMLELEYVATGNELIDAQLTNLENALSTTNGVLTTLGNIQNIHNDLIVNSRASIPFNYVTGTGGNYVADYSLAASTQFGAPIIPTVPSIYITYTGSVPTAITAAGLSIFNQLLAIKSSLLVQIRSLSAQSGATALVDPNSLYNTLKKVVADLSSQFGATINGVFMSATPNFDSQDQAVALRSWILDRYNIQNTPSAANAGIIQQDITTAITAAQTLNNTQKENVQNYIFIFQEYYQSASALLQAITQIIEKMAQGISGQ